MPSFRFIIFCPRTWALLLMPSRFTQWLARMFFRGRAEFSDAIFAGVSISGGIWGHFLGWWEHRNDPNVLWICYEDLKEDLVGSIKRIASFMDVPMDEELISIVAKNSSFEFMSTHGSQFDDHFLRDKVKVRMGLDEESNVIVGKVRKDGGKVGGRKMIPEAVSQLLEERWEASFGRQEKLASYDAMREAIRKEQQKREAFMVISED